MWRKKQLRQKSSPSCVGGVTCEYVSASWPRCPWCPGSESLAGPAASRYVEVCVQTNTGAWWPAGSGGRVPTRGTLSHANRWGNRDSEQLCRGSSVVEQLRSFTSKLLLGLDARAPGWGGAKHGGHAQQGRLGLVVLPPSAPTALAVGAGRVQLITQHGSFSPAQDHVPGSLTPQNPVVRSHGPKPCLVTRAQARYREDFWKQRTRLYFVVFFFFF